MSRERFIVTISPKVWEFLNLDDPIRRRTALAAFYNGYGMEQLNTLMSGSMDSRECVELREVSELIGLLPTDDIVRSAYVNNKRTDGGTGLRVVDSSSRRSNP